MFPFFVLDVSHINIVVGDIDVGVALCISGGLQGACRDALGEQVAEAGICPGFPVRT